MVLSFGLTPGEGPGLVFVIYRSLLDRCHWVHCSVHYSFFLMVIAALTSSIGMLEPAVSWLEEHKGFKRTPIAIITGNCIWFCGLAALFSFNILSGFTPLDQFPMFEGKTIFDLMDFGTANILIPCGALLVALFAGWIMPRESIREELGLDEDLTFYIWRFLVHFIAPAAIVLVFIVNLAGD